MAAMTRRRTTTTTTRRIRTTSTRRCVDEVGGCAAAGSTVVPPGTVFVVSFLFVAAAATMAFLTALTTTTTTTTVRPSLPWLPPLPPLLPPLPLAAEAAVAAAPSAHFVRDEDEDENGQVPQQLGDDDAAVGTRRQQRRSRTSTTTAADETAASAEGEGVGDARVDSDAAGAEYEYDFDGADGRRRRRRRIRSENGVLALSSDILTDTERYSAVVFDDDEEEVDDDGDGDDGTVFRRRRRTTKYSSSSPSPSSSLLLLLIHDPTCPHSSSMLRRVEEAAAMMRRHLLDDDEEEEDGGGNGGDEENSPSQQQQQRQQQRPPPLFGKLEVDSYEIGGVLLDYAITSVPTLLYVTRTPVAVASSSPTTAATTPGREECEKEETDAGDETTPNSSSRSSSSSSFSSLLLEYTGLSETPADVFRTTLHYYYRLVAATGGITSSSTDWVQIEPPSFPSYEEARGFVRDRRRSLLRYAAVPQGLDRHGKAYKLPTTEPSHGDFDGDGDDDEEEERKYLEWLVREEQGEETIAHDRKRRRQQQPRQYASSPSPDDYSLPDDFVLVLQYRCEGDGQRQQNELYELFDQMSRALSNRRDRFFASISDCSSSSTGADGTRQDGAVAAIKIPLDFFESIGSDAKTSQFNDFEKLPKATLPPNRDRLVEFMVKTCTPSLLVFDRQATAPIAFAKYRKVHAVLFVDTINALFERRQKDTGSINFDDGDDFAVARGVVREFRRVCRRHQRRHFGDVLDADMVCMIVPSTETRVLMTMGIDVWGSTATATTERLEDHVDNLPLLLITDQRQGGTRRYYLEIGALCRTADAESSSTGARGDSIDDDMLLFVERFWQGRLQPDVKSDPVGSRTNSAGVRIVTAESWHDEIFARTANDTATRAPKHAMIAFVSPTCGHCKRFNVLFSRLAEFLRHIKWDSILTLYRMDVTKNELVASNLTVRWLPDLYYVSLPAGHSNRDGNTNRSSFDHGKRMVRYDWKDDVGDDGTINDTIDFMRWFLHIANLTNLQLQELLSKLPKIG